LIIFCKRPVGVVFANRKACYDSLKQVSHLFKKNHKIKARN